MVEAIKTHCDDLPHRIGDLETTIGNVQTFLRLPHRIGDLEK